MSKNYANIILANILASTVPVLKNNTGNQILVKYWQRTCTMRTVSKGQPVS